LLGFIHLLVVGLEDGAPMKRHEDCPFLELYTPPILIDDVEESQLEKSLGELKLLEDTKGDHILGVLGQLPQLKEAGAVDLQILNELRSNRDPDI
jgi:hypothetical protein